VKVWSSGTGNATSQYAGMGDKIQCRGWGWRGEPTAEGRQAHAAVE